MLKKSTDRWKSIKKSCAPLEIAKEPAVLFEISPPAHLGTKDLLNSRVRSYPTALTLHVIMNTCERVMQERKPQKKPQMLTNENMR